MSQIGKKIRTLRERHNISIRQLGNAIGVSHTYVLKIENGDRRPSIDVVAALSRYFSVSTDVLILDELELDE